MTRLLWAVALFALGYALRRPICQKIHVEYRYLDPAIVRQPPEGDDGIQPPDPRTWTATPTDTGNVTIAPPPTGTADPWLRR